MNCNICCLALEEEEERWDVVETSSTCMLNLHPPPLPPPFPFEITFPPSVPSTLPYGTLNPPNKRWKVPIAEKDSSSENKTETVSSNLNKLRVTEHSAFKIELQLIDCQLTTVNLIGCTFLLLTGHRIGSVSRTPSDVQSRGRTAQW